MKLLVIGCGQCGGRIADQFARMNVRARVQRGIEIITGNFAVNTDTADLTGLSFIRRDPEHRILVGLQRTGGHGVGKINELGYEIAKDDSDKVIEALRNVPRLFETDAFLVVASAAGGTGSGAIAVLTHYLKESYPEKPVYNLIVLPFKYEEMTEERSIYNSATCLKSVYLVADAVILVDNERFIKKNLSIRGNLSRINSLIAEPFYNLLCAGEEKEAKYIGSKILDAGDIIQTLSGWTAIGYARKSPRRSLFGYPDFRKKAIETQSEIESINAALADLSVKCNPRDANRALYLLSTPPEKMNMNLTAGVATILRDVAPNAIIRSGDYPRERRSLNVTVILSELSVVRKVIDYFDQAIVYISRKTERPREFELRRLEDTFKNLPTLI